MPASAVDLARVSNSPMSTVVKLAQVADRFAADLIHGHLLHGPDMAQIAALGLPLVVTIHNMQPGWPNGVAALRAEDTTLLVACAQAVEADIRAARLPVPVRTAWNGIDFMSLERTPALCAAGPEFRRQHGLAPADFMLLALANPRPQKRLDQLPRILACTQREFARRGIARPVRLVFSGECSRRSEAALVAEKAIYAEVARLGLGGSVTFLGSVSDVAPVLAAADVLVSCSAFEGLSLAHLEALAARLPVVATEAGGTAEIALGNPAITVLPLDAAPEDFAAVVAAIAEARPPDGRTQAAVHFCQARMCERYGQLYPSAIEAARRDNGRDGLLLIANNFSTGGAQSSARRLLFGLAGQGIRVRAAVVEEEPAYPTPGRKALTAAGIEVRVLPRAGTIDPARAVALLLERIHEDPPETVLFWNVIQEYKILLADALLDVPVFDVSPGEMYFSSLERYFQRPRPGLPYRTGADYGRRLAGVIVKFQAETEHAARILQAPVHVVPNGVPLPTAPSAPRPLAEPLVISTLARISPQKKLEELLAALHQTGGRMPPYILRIAGGIERGCSAYAEELRRLSTGLPVEWVGEQDDVSPFLQESDLFALIAEPAGCPNASLEAMAHGLAVVITDVGGAAEQVEDSVTGRLVPRGDTAALAEALIELASDTQMRYKCGAAGRRRIEAYFNQERMVADYRRVVFSGSS
jgi:glycosyltransferase involved in cell wall biosynthesis